MVELEIKEKNKSKISKITFISPSDLLIQEQQTEIIKTGSQNLNELLGGGFRLGEITEAYGSFNTGKSQLAFTLCVNLSKLNSNYCTLFIDTESSFRSARIVEIAEEKGLDSKKILESIKLLKIKSTGEQIDIIEKLSDILESEPNIKLIIIDSLIANLRAEYLGREQLIKRQQILANMLHKLGEAVEKHKVGIYITNQVGTDPNCLFGDPTVALGGNVLAHFSQTRLYFRSGSKGNKVVKLTDSSCLPCGEALFKITTGGISD